MPLAVPIRQALGEDPAPRAVIAAIAEIAGTLEVLAGEGVAHRDIKPDNLFKPDDRWVIGDFGLVTYPDKNPRTEHGRKLGPTDFMAPEMRQDADLAAPGPADVWALAKTLWVLLASETLPLPGTHRATEPAHAPAGTDHVHVRGRTRQAARGRHADRARGPGIDVGDGPGVAACLGEPPEVRLRPGIAQLRARAAAMTANSRQAVADGMNRRAVAADTWNELARIVYDAGTELGDALTFEVRGAESGYQAAAMLDHRRSRPCIATTPLAA